MGWSLVNLSIFLPENKMKKRRVYWRRKGKKIIAEGIRNNKTVYLFQLPDFEKVLESSLFSSEKREKIKEIIARLDYKKKSDKE
jgi:hypothetical protein